MNQRQEKSGACPSCGRHCPPDDLHCPRGRAYFGLEAEGGQHDKKRREINIEDETILLMLKCGHLLHHGLVERAGSEDMLSFLSPEEKNDLTAALKKCADVWSNLE